MKRQNSSICPICKTKTYVTINVLGCDDGEDGAFETNPRECLKCEGIKAAVPEIHKMMIEVWDKYEDIRKENKLIENKIRSELYSERDITEIIYNDEYKQSILSAFKKERESCNKISISLGTPVDSDWVFSKALNEVYNVTMMAIKGNRERRLKLNFF